MEPVAAPPQETGPVMDVVPPPSAEPKPKEPASPAAAPKPAEPKPAAVPKPPRDGATTAIIATVVIVLGLAVLIVFAYLKTQ